MNQALSSRRSATAIVLGALCLTGCGVIDRLTGNEEFSIRQFSLDQPTIASGTPVLLSWDVDGAESVEIDNGVGKVAAKGSKQLRPELTATYTLTARAGTSSANATVQLTVRGSGSNFLLPTPSPTPSPTPTPKAPAPGATPTPAPPGSGTDKAAFCGLAAKAPTGCALRVVKGTLGAGECIELTAISFNQACPVAFATSRRLAFTVNANTRAGAELRWRRARASADVLTPPVGTVLARGATSVELDDLALSQALVIEIADGERVLLTFSAGHE